MEPACWLLARSDVLSAPSRYLDRGGSSDTNRVLVFVIIAVALIWAGLYFWGKYRSRQFHSGRTKKSLFLELCQAHNLSRTDRGLLLRAADVSGLEQPAHIFVDPDLLGKLSCENTTEAEAYSQLMQRVFGDLGRVS